MKYSCLLGLFLLLVSCSVRANRSVKENVIKADDTVSLEHISDKGDAQIISINQHSKSDSTKAEAILKETIIYKNRHKVGEVLLFVARKFLGVPYVSHTLDTIDEEKLTINLEQLDCTTYLEYVLALTLTAYKNDSTYYDFIRQLKDIRYRGGELSYENRLHYFDWWLTDNEKMGFVKEINTPNPPFSAKQVLKINYMSENAHAYSMLRNHPERVQVIKKIEDTTNGKVVNYIPKSVLNNNTTLRSVIHDGDLLALVTNKKNLDTTHLGIAVWKKDGLYLINASSLKKNGQQVVEPSETLYHYLMARPWNTGIRVARVVINN